jgi:Serine dehydratase beta chain
MTISAFDLFKIGIGPSSSHRFSAPTGAAVSGGIDRRLGKAVLD